MVWRLSRNRYFYLDADVHPIVARILRGRGFDAVSANDVGHRAPR